MKIEEILKLEVKKAVAELTKKQVKIRDWEGENGLEKEYEPKLHEINDKAKYPDIVNKDGTTEKVSRVSYSLQKLAVKRMAGLMFGIPVQRAYNYDSKNEKQKQVVNAIEKILERNRIDSLNLDRARLLFAGCEALTVWYAIEEANELYGFKSNVKLKCKNYSQSLGDKVFPLFDEYGDLVALSVQYARDKDLFLDTYTKESHIRFYKKEGADWVEQFREAIAINKIPAVYLYRPTPIWEDSSSLVSEMEWTVSRNGNYLRANSRPLFALFTDELISYGDEESPNKAFKGVMQLPKDAQANYITWEQAVENLKFYVSEMRQLFFSQLQIPDWSFETMKSTPMSGESRKQLFIDAQLKVVEERGRFIEFFDREINVIKAYLKEMMPLPYSVEIDKISVEVIISPYSINDEREKIQNLMIANGNKPIITQREAIKYLGWSTDIEQTLKELKEDSVEDVLNLSE